MLKKKEIALDYIDATGSEDMIENNQLSVQQLVLIFLLCHIGPP